MPLRKKYKKKKRVYKKRYRRRRKFIPRPLGRPSYITRGCFLTSITAQAAVETYGAFSFALSDLPNYTEFTTLFDEYRLLRVTLYFHPVRLTTNTSSGNTVPWFLYAIDKDDSGAPTAYNELLQYPGCRITSMYGRHKVSFVPRLAMPVYNGVTDAYASKVSYIDCNNVAVPHYGFKWGVGSSTVASTFSYTVFCKYKMAFRGVR